jgi:hypothetical protein
MEDCIGLAGFTGNDPGLLDARDPNCVVHCTEEVIGRKAAAEREDGAAIDRSARREAPFRSIVVVR